jgi:ArsR family transcriptional regulator
VACEVIAMTKPPASYGLDPDAIWLAQALRALGNPARMAIVRRLGQGECFCCGIVDGLPLAQSTVSQHLAVLRRAGLVRSQEIGTGTWSCLDGDALARVKRLVAELG